MTFRKITSALCLIAFLATLTFLPSTTLAQGTQSDTFKTPDITAEGTIAPGQGFIPCSGTTCSPCQLIVLFNTVIKWFLTISFLIFAIVALVAGIKLVTQGNPGALADAKKSFTNAFIGLIIILAAFLIVDTLMRYLVRDGGEIRGYGPWQELKCATQTTARTTAFFDGDVPYVPGTMMTPSKGAQVYSGGQLGQCNNSSCSPSALMSAGFTATQANVMSCIALTESSGNPSTPPFNVTNPNHRPLSTACGLFQVTRTTWNGNGISSGSCDSFSQCTNASCNTKAALQLVRASGYSSWTCPGCNNKASFCVRQYGG